jgi:hypothetical protein
MKDFRKTFIKEIVQKFASIRQKSQVVKQTIKKCHFVMLVAKLQFTSDCDVI